MPLSLEQYAEYLQTRDLPWPAAPKAEPARAKPHMPEMAGVKCVLWNVYGTLLGVPGGEVIFEHDNDFVMTAALEKTIHEFKMWQSMSRKPGQPSEYMREMYTRALQDFRNTGSPGERFSEVASERVWLNLLKKLFQKDYTFDANFYGSLNEYAEKVAFFYQASIQGCGPNPGAADAVGELAAAGVRQGLLGDGQCYTRAQLTRAVEGEDWLDDGLIALSFQKLARKPSDTLFTDALEKLEAAGVSPGEVLHVGSDLDRDIAPAKQYGFKTALYAGDRASLKATPAGMKDPKTKPDALITELTQVPRLLSV